MATPRKTMAEVRAEERSRGFFECMRILELEWLRTTRSTASRVEGEGPLWPTLEKMQAHAGLLDEDHKAFTIPRRWGKSFDRLRVRVVLRSSHPHAGRKGFILDSASSMENGLHRVFFLDGLERKADNAMARPDQIKRIKQ